MLDKTKFFETFRAKAGPLKTSQVAGVEIVLAAMAGAPLSHTAYALATAWHETNKTMEPVVEAYWLSEAWRKQNLRYYPWHGRGYVQLTWEFNYDKADAELAKAGMIKPGALLAKPDLALKPEIAAFIMRHGMDQGWFTGVSFRKVLPSKGVATREQYMNARTIINGRDKADLIEDYAQWFEKALRDGGWP
jgi:putative chitinase